MAIHRRLRRLSACTKAPASQSAPLSEQPMEGLESESGPGAITARASSTDLKGGGGGAGSGGAGSSRLVARESELGVFADALSRTARLHSDSSVSLRSDSSDASDASEATVLGGHDDDSEEDNLHDNNKETVEDTRPVSTAGTAGASKHKSAVDPSQWSVGLPSYQDAELVDYSTIGDADKEGAREAIRNTYSTPPSCGIKVRGPGYLVGSKIADRSLKVGSEAPPYAICGVNVFTSKKRSLEHIATKVESLRELLSNASLQDADDTFPPYLLICWTFKTLFSREHTCVAHLFKRDDAIVAGLGPAFRSAFREFSRGTNAQQSSRLKFFFHVEEAAPVLRKSISALGGERPVLIAKKLTTKFFVQPNYIEISTDVGSSTIASMLHSTVSKTSRQMVVDTQWCIEAKHENELPERVLGAVRWNFVDINDIVIDLDAAAADEADERSS